MQPILTIGIPTVFGREKKYDRLVDEINRQITEDTLQGIVEVISYKDNKEISIGAKRDWLYKNSKGIYSVQIDDDDMIAGHYLKTVVDDCLENDDCIGYIEDCTINGDKSRSLFSINYPGWIEKITPNQSNYFCNRVRTPFMKSPIKTEICQKVGVKDMRFGEDHDFAVRVLPHLKTMTFINEPMYFYIHEKEGTHEERFGL